MAHRPVAAVITICTHRKKVRQPVTATAVSLPSDSQAAVQSAWIGKIQTLQKEVRAGGLYAGRGFGLAVEAARIAEAKLYILSAGLGLVAAGQRVPVYGLDHGATHWSAAVGPLLVAIQTDAGSVEFGQGIRRVEHASTEPVDRPDHQDVELPADSVLEQLVKGRSLIPTICAADALVLVGLDDQPATMLCHPCQDEPLILGGLIVTADPQVDRRANAIGVHSSSSKLYRNDSTDPNLVEPIVRNGVLCQMAGGGGAAHSGGWRVRSDSWPDP